MANMLCAVTLALCCVCGVHAARPVQTCQQLADLMRPGMSVDPGISITDDQAADLGQVTGSSSNPGWWQVNWYNGHAGSYRMGADKKYDLFPADLGCRPEASQLELEPSDVCCTAACTHIIISGSTTAQIEHMTHYTLTHQVYSGRPVYSSDSNPYFLYYHGENSMWMVGAYVGSNTARMYVIDNAMSPDKIRGTWRLAVAGSAVSFPAVKASCAECRQITISGSVHHQVNRMTTYSLTSQINEGRPVYSSDTTNDFLYFYEPYDVWIVGNVMGGSSGGLLTNDIHLYPEQTEAVWEVYDGSQWVPFPRLRVRCTDVDECASTPCLNGGVCTDMPNSYSCACATGWGGHNCALTSVIQRIITVVLLHF
ncbi:uncharacterized protein LOC118405074 [Branchiostoma floridae]|uniref:Uncharacterized protein LOC118405074 n=1 Tax=Branchiostoma floridae TaxID=7739 RepID=A0A9J7HIN3_BRAFL|nr:uncharacterized protein LOC118405074 [Branchiostoma floridae]